MAEPITTDNLRARMENRLAFLHYNDQYHGRHAGVYEFLSEILADDILEDDGYTQGGDVIRGGLCLPEIFQRKGVIMGWFRRIRDRFFPSDEGLDELDAEFRSNFDIEGFDHERYRDYLEGRREMSMSMLDPESEDYEFEAETASWDMMSKEENGNFAMI